jgi:hypothetical protein
MTSNRQNKANRANAMRSTGPKTAVGKAKSSKNARQHGLSKLLIHETHQLASLTALLMGDVGVGEQIDPTNIVRAKFELNRIRQVRREMIVAFLEATDAVKTKRLRNLQRYERQAFARQKRALKMTNGARFAVKAESDLAT